jgi:hypothetical protein
MRFIPTRVHGVLDYVFGLTLMVLPFLGGFASSWAEAMVPAGVGIATVFFSLFTQYECGVRSVIPMRLHLGLDLAGGLFLAASPWVFGFHRTLWAPHVAFGLFAVVVSLTTVTTPRAAPPPPERYPDEPVPAGTGRQP